MKISTPKYSLQHSQAFIIHTTAQRDHFPTLNIVEDNAKNKEQPFFTM